MELVHGVKITEHWDAQRLGLRQRLELFIQVCHAIQHAHQKGIIHRDIKPSNVLVSSQDGQTVPKVIDFGIVRAIEGRLPDQTTLTGGDQFVGTPAYMSPEQAEGGADLDTRSDVYSLGILLFELLTGATPFDGKRLREVGLFEMLRILREEEAPAPSALLAAMDPDNLAAVAASRGLQPSQLVAAVKGDLDWIVLKALSKDRRSRYDTVNGLAADLRRFLNDEPVTARSPGRLYLFGKLVRRNRAVAASAAAVVLALMAGLVASSWFYLREREARQVQVRLRKAAEAARANETRLLQQSKARESVSQAAILLAGGNIAEANALLGKTPLTSIEPSLEAANLFHALGDWNAVRQRWKQAADCYALYLQANRLDRTPARPNGLAVTLSIGPTLVEGRNLPEYRRFCDEAVSRYGRTTDPINAAVLLKACLLVPTDRSSLEGLRPAAELIAENMEEDDLSRGINVYQRAFMVMSMGLLEYRRGNYTDALESNRRCLALPDRNEARSATVHAISAMAAERLGQRDLAQSELEQAQEAFKRPFAQGSPVPRGEGQGVWQDWAIARILLREAATQVDRKDVAPR
jgi:tetratricopeptide (TPR) repeat protein